MTRVFLVTCATLAIAATFPAEVLAQDAQSKIETETATTNEGDIIVTARRREETAQETPVAMTVLNSTLLDRYGVKGVASIAQFTPGLVTGESSGAMGGTISLRGVGSGDSMAFIDQAVSSSVDGVPISSAQILRAAQLDLQQIEVLRGPQSLFFGKNSPGGIISLTTAEPGDTLEMMVRGGYEFTADEMYGEAMLSVPLGEGLGVRVAGRYSKMDGYIKIVSPPVAGTTPTDITRFPKQEELFLRGALSWTPTDQLSIRIKGTVTDTDMIGGSSNFSDIVACPYGVPQRPSEDASNCLNDGSILLTQIPAAAMALSPYLTNPNGNRNNNQMLLSGTIDYAITSELSLTSVTGLYTIKERLTSNGAYGPISNNAFGVQFDSDQFTQELRLASDFSGQLNFLVGGFYEERKLFTLTSIVVPQFFLRLPTESTNQKQTSSSVFGQLLYDPTEQIQVTVGGRYTHEVKKLLDFSVTPVVAGAFGTPVDVTDNPLYGSTKLTFNNFSPELTLTYKPQDDLMLFASFKRGFKSGGFDAGYTNAGILANPARNQKFDPENVSGGEIGLKSMLVDRQVTLNLTGYWYDYKGLQVSVFDTTSRAFRLQNAAAAQVRGVEAEMRYRPASIPGLSLHAALAYNDSKFQNYLADCYAGQTQALGCNQILNTATSLFTAQDLSGERLRKAPVFAGTAGGYYETPIFGNAIMSISADMSYSGGYEYGSNYQPLAYQNAFAKADATLRLFDQDNSWEVALIGRNLTNKRNLINGIDRTGTGGTKGGNLPSCTSVTGTGCVKISDIIGTPTLPRTVALQLTFRF